MDFDSPDPDAEKEFPGLYASESAAGRKKDDEDFSGGDHEKVSKKELLLLGRRKEKKDKKDRGYATLDGESSPEEDFETKSPSKSQSKKKTFKFTSSRSKEKREKSRDKEKTEKEVKEKEKDREKKEKKKEKEKEKKDKDKDKKESKEKEKEKQKESKEKEKEKKESKDKEKEKKDSKDKEKDKKEGKEKEKDKKESKEKDKEKKHHKDEGKEHKDKKAKQSVTADTTEINQLGVAQPIFGVSLGLAVVRSHCHDNVNLPLIVRECIDYLQEHGLRNEHIYKVDVVKTKLQQLKTQYNNREPIADNDFDISTACSLLKLFIHELPEPLLTTDLLPRFEEIATGTVASQTAQLHDFSILINQLPSCNRTLLTWLLLHFDSILKNEKTNKMNIQTLAMLLGPTLQMSHRLLVTMLSHAAVLFPDTVLSKYKPPITSTSTSPNIPETPDEINEELRKQESLLSQIHAEMNAGFVSKKREEQLWEVSRIITQLKRKLRSFEKKQDSMQKSIDDGIGDDDDESLKTTIISTESNTETKTSPQEAIDTTLQSMSSSRVGKSEEALNTTANDTHSPDKISMNENGLILLPETHPDYLNLIRLQLENFELLQWKQRLQSRIQYERAEVTKLKAVLNAKQPTNHATIADTNADALNSLPDGSSYERVVAQYVLENTLLEQKKNFLAKEIFEENQKVIQLQVDLAIRQLQI